MKDRIDRRFAALKAEGRAAFVAYVMGGDPDAATSLEILKGLPSAGADIIELGFPFSDPMAEGPTIQLASQRALAGGMRTPGVLQLVRDFRAGDVRHSLADISKARTRLGYEPTHRIGEGLAEAMDWYVQDLS